MIFTIADYVAGMLAGSAKALAVRMIGGPGWTWSWR